MNQIHAGELLEQGKTIEEINLMVNWDKVNSFLQDSYVDYDYNMFDEIKTIEDEMNKIIKANLPQELSKYFLFDAMQSSELLKKNVFAQIIKDNIENVMGFKKYLQLKRAAEKLQQEWAQQRLEAEKEAAEYNKYCQNKQELEKALEENEKKLDDLYKFITAQQEEYERAKAGAENTANIQKKINELYVIANRVKADIGKEMDYINAILWIARS